MSPLHAPIRRKIDGETYQATKKEGETVFSMSNSALL